MHQISKNFLPQFKSTAQFARRPLLHAGIAWLASLTLLAGCANIKSSTPSENSSGLAELQLQGLDLSGQYNFMGIRCTDSTLSTTLVTTDYQNYRQDSLIIRGNSLSQLINSNNCLINLSGQITATDGQLSLTNLTVTNVTSGACTLDNSVLDPSLTPTRPGTDYVHGAQLTAIDRQSYLFDAQSEELGIPVALTDSSAQLLCFSIYRKLHLAPTPSLTLAPSLQN